VHYHIDTPGFRTRQITLVTTRLDAELSRVADLAELYHERWQVETSLAHLKTTRQMDVRHGKTVPGVLKELMVCAIVYNLVRMVIRPSATLHHTEVERICFLFLGGQGQASAHGGLLKIRRPADRSRA
jgi:hypothetical protein